MLPLHMGALHPIEQWLTVFLAFGPFVLLGVVLWVRSRDEDADEMQDTDETPDAVPEDRTPV